MSDKQTVISLAKSGVPPRDIATQTDVAIGSIYAYISEARREGVTIPRFSTAGIAPTDATRLTVPADVSLVLVPEAQIRGITTAALANLLLKEITQSDLVGAVLDDVALLEAELSSGGGLYDQ